MEMNQPGEKSHHLVNFLNRIGQAAIEEMVENEDLIFSLNMPSKIVDRNMLDNPLNEINELGIDQIPNANKNYFKPKANISCSQMIETIFKEAQINGNIISQSDQTVDSQFLQQLNDQKKIVENDYKRYEKFYKMRNDGVEYAGKFQKFQKSQSALISFIQQNEEQYVKLANQTFNSFKNTDKKFQKAFYPINFDPANYKDYFQPDRQGEFKAPGFKKIQYNSNQDTLDQFSFDSQIDRQKADFLQGLGLGQPKNNMLESSLDESFQSIDIKAEYLKIGFQRDWMDQNIFMLPNLQIKGQQQKSWSNGAKFDQKDDSKFPYYVVAAIIIRNVEIQGLKYNEKQRSLLSQIQYVPQNNFALFFQLSDDLNISQNPLQISFNTPRILGYILKPVKPFPLLGVQPSKIKEDFFFSSTDNFQSFNELNNYKKKFQMIGGDENIYVTFINKKDYADKFFRNFENLYKQCTDEWTKNLKMKINICDYEQVDGYQFKIHVILDKSGQTFTKGYGETLEFEDSESYYNQKFGQKEFHELISSEHPDLQTIQKCKALILHEIGRIFGLIREQIIPSQHYQLKSDKVIDFYKQNIEEMNEEMNIIESEHEILKKANERANLNIFSKADFSNFESIDEDSVMFIGYPKSWVSGPSNYSQKLNYQLSKNDLSLVFEKYGDKILEKEKEIEICINDGNYTDDEIIDIYSSDQQISKIPNWKNKLKDLIQQVRIRLQPQPLPAFKNYDQKSKLIFIFQDKNFTQEWQQDFKLDDRIFKIKYQGLQKNEVEQFKISFEKYKILTDRIEQVFEQDINICKQLFQKQGEINFDEIKNITFIHIEVLKILYQKYFQQQQEDEKNYNIQKLKNLIQQCINNNYSKQKIFDACQGIQIDDFENIVQQLIDQYSSNENQLPSFQNYSQKKNLILQLQKDNVDLDDDDIIIKDKFLGISKPDLKIFKNYYKKNKILTNTKDDLMQEEMQELKEKIQLQIQNQQLNFMQLQQESLILKQIIEDIFDEQIKSISELFKDKKDLLTKYFNECSKTQRTKDQLLNLIVKQDPQLKFLMIQMFRQNSDNYIKLKKLLNHNKLGDYLFLNEIEDFVDCIKKDEINNAVSIVEKYFKQDPIFVMKLYYYLNKQSENKQEEPSQQFQTMQIVLNKDYEIIQTSGNRNILRVISKSLLIQNEAGKQINNSQFEYLIEYEQRQLFINQNKEDINMFLQDFTKQKLNKYDQTFKICFEQLIKKHNKLNIQLSDFDFIEYYILEQQGFEYLMKVLKKDIKDENLKGLIDINDIDTISRHLRIPIFIHQKDIFAYECLGQMYLKEENEKKSAIHIQCDQLNEQFFIEKPIDLKIQMEIVDALQFEQKYKTIFHQLPLWMRHFFGFKTIFQYIYDEKSNMYDQDRIQILFDVAQSYQWFEKQPNDDNFKSLQQSAMSLQNSNINIFNEWFESIQINQNYTGNNFALKYKFYQARFNPVIQQNILEEIKQKFPDPEIIYNLEDFNKISSKIDNNQLQQKFIDSHNNPEQFIQNIFQQVFSFINRRENISQLVEVLSNLNLQVEISSRFLFSLVLQNSDINLRTRILDYQSEYFAVPLIMNSQLSKGNNELHYVPEIVFCMMEGIGIFNFSLGKRCIHPIGKSQLLNDLLFPETKISHEAFEQQDRNLFSTGQVDVFFEKNFNIKRNFVIMDGQGHLKDEVMVNSLILSNIVMIHFHCADLYEKCVVDELINYIEIIKNKDISIMIIFIIRDASETKILKFEEESIDNNSLQQVNDVGKKYKLLSPIENYIDVCIQLRNMGQMQKKDRIQELKPMLQIFYHSIQKMGQNKDNFKFTKARFQKEFIFKDKSQNSNAYIINDIVQKSQQFLEKVIEIKENVFDDNALPLLKLKNNTRQSILNIRTTTENDIQIQDAKEEQLENLKKQIIEIPPTQILILFKSLVLEKNSSILFQNISKNLRDLTAENIQNLKEKKQKLFDDHKNVSNNQIKSKQEINKSLEELKIQQKMVENQIYQKSVSLEYFWRCLLHYLEQNTSFTEWNQGQEKRQLINCIQQQIQNGDCFELIDGENLQFNGLLLKEAVKDSKNDKVIVVCVIGPQSSGKSTLLNFSFGTQFFTSAGRCTKGIYFTLQKFPDDFPNSNKVKWLIMLDTEGLQSPERYDDEYDRKIVLFAMLSSDVLIINSKGEINSTMINTLKVCCVTYDEIKQFGNKPEIIYTSGQNSDQSKEPFKNQVQDLYQMVVDAKYNDSETIQQTALDLFGYNDDKINVFGSAFKNEIIQKDNQKGIMQNLNFKINDTQFGVETAHILEIISKLVNNNEKKNFRDLQIWITSSGQNWDLIDRFCSSLIQFQNLEEIKNDKKIMNFFNYLWNQYYDKEKVDYNDHQLCKKLADELIEVYKNYGEESLLIKQNAFLIHNNKKKDDDLKLHVFDEYDKWKQLPEQNGITVGMEKKYINNIITKNELLKNQFEVILKNKVQEKKLQLINRNGLKGVQDRAMEIRRDANFQSMSQYQQVQQLNVEFKIIFQEIIKEIKGMDSLAQLKKNYFNSLVQQFGIHNKFIQKVSDQQYKELDQIIFVDKAYLNSKLLNDLLIDKLTRFENKSQESKNRLFQFNKEMIMQIPEDPKYRIFDAQIEENYLSLQEIIQCDYIYKISSDLRKDILRDQLYKQMKQIFSIQIEEKQKKECKDFLGKSYNKQINVNLDDDEEQKKQIKTLFSFLQRAGFRYYYGKEIDLSCINLDDVFKSFGQNQISQNDKKQLRQDKKDQWAKNISQSIIFDEYSYKELSSQIMNLFKSNSVLIENRKNPNESILDHKHFDKKLNNAVYISEPKIDYKKSKSAKQIPDKSFKTFIQPKTSDCNQNDKWTRLSDIAFRQLNWEKIVEKIIKSVLEVIGQDNQSSSIDSKKQNNIDDILFYQLSNSQIKNLETNYMQTQLKSKLNDELNQKLCLYISKEFDSKISWCAILVSWVELYKKAEKICLNQIKNLEKQEAEQREFFNKIALGKNDEITIKNTKKIAELAFKQYQDQIRDIMSDEIIKKDLEDVKHNFNNQEIYNYLDNQYLRIMQKDTKNFLDYVENPVEKFKEEVERRAKIYFSGIIQQKREKACQQIKEAIDVLYQITNLIYQQSQKYLYWHQLRIENYFEVFDENYQQISNNKLLDISSYFSPVILDEIIKIIEGNFQMDPFTFIFNGIDQKINYQLTPIGPLQLFADQDFKNNVQNLHLKYQNEESYGLLKEIIQFLKKNQQSDEYQIFQINNFITELNQFALQKKIQFCKQQEFDEKYFNCMNEINEIKLNAIGCQERCKFCGRKCEQQQHQVQVLIKQDDDQLDQQIETERHSCSKVGHQMRVFAGGHYIKKYLGKDIKVPSLHTCDIIDPMSKILINGQAFIWKEILNTQLQDWNIEYISDSENQKQQVFDSFWSVVGKNYCEKSKEKYFYRERIKNIQELNQIHQSKIVVIALDGSSSMKGEPWDKQVHQAKLLIDFIQNNHIQTEKVRLVILFFNGKKDIKEAHDENLDKKVEDIWKFPGGGTDFDPPFMLGFTKIKQYIDQNEQGELHFFTDGQADYPHQAFDMIQKDLEESQNQWFLNQNLKLRIFIYCLEENNKALESFAKDLNALSQHKFNVDLCGLQIEIKLDQLGELMIENFIFNN